MERKPVASPAQCRAARALLKWTQGDLAEHAQVARKTVADFEAGVRQLHLRTRVCITSALQAAGVEFTWSDAAEGTVLTAQRLSRGQSLHESEAEEE